MLTHCKLDHESIALHNQRLQNTKIHDSSINNLEYIIYKIKS